MAVKPQSTSEPSENKEKQEGRNVKKGGGGMTKVILRRLPPTMTEAELIEQISPLPPYDYFLFVAADPSLAPWSFCRAYVNFTNVEDVILFRDRFDGYVFVDQRGSEYPAIVEMAPCPKVPKKTKRDPKCGSLEDDPEYKAFLELLKNPIQVPLLTLEQRLEEIDKKDKERKETKGFLKMSTPLTEFIKQKREEKLRKKQQKEDERRKRIEWEKQMREQEKRRLQREKERREREAKKEAKEHSTDVPPRFAAAKEEGGKGKRKDGGVGAGGTKAVKKSNWKEGERKQQHHEGAAPREYYGKPQGQKKAAENKKKAPTPAVHHRDEQQPHQQQSAAAGSSSNTPRMSEERDHQWTTTAKGQPENRAAVAATGPKTGDAGAGSRPRGGDRQQSKANKYKEKPSLPLYQPGRKKPAADDEKRETAD